MFIQGSVPYEGNLLILFFVEGPVLRQGIYLLFVEGPVYILLQIEGHFMYGLSEKERPVLCRRLTISSCVWINRSTLLEDL